jgi:hypothetical protein
MAETYSTEYTVLLQSTPGAKTFAYGSGLYIHPFSYTQAANGSAGDTVILARLAPKATVHMHFCQFRFAGFAASTVLAIGWKAYRDVNGVTVAADDDGLINDISIASDGSWTGGMLIVATPDDSAPIVWVKDFNNMDPVLIFATIGTTAPGAADTLDGHIGVRYA